MTEALREEFVAPAGDIFNPDGYECCLFRETKEEKADKVGQLKTAFPKHVDQVSFSFDGL